MKEQFALISGADAYMVTGRVNALDTARSLAGPMTFVYNATDEKDFGRFLESPVASKVTVYGPLRTIVIYPIAASN